MFFYFYTAILCKFVKLKSSYCKLRHRDVSTFHTTENVLNVPLFISLGPSLETDGRVPPREPFLFVNSFAFFVSQVIWFVSFIYVFSELLFVALSNFQKL